MDVYVVWSAFPCFRNRLGAFLFRLLSRLGWVQISAVTIACYGTTPALAQVARTFEGALEEGHPWQVVAPGMSISFIPCASESDAQQMQRTEFLLLRS